MSDQNKLVKILAAPSKELDQKSYSEDDNGREDSALYKDERYLNLQKLLDSIINDKDNADDGGDDQTEKKTCSSLHCKVGKLYGEDTDGELGFISFVSSDEERIVILIPFIKKFSNKINSFEDAVYKHVVRFPGSRDEQNLSVMRSLAKNNNKFFPIFPGFRHECKQIIFDMNPLSFSQLYFAVSFLRVPRPSPPSI